MTRRKGALYRWGLWPYSAPAALPKVTRSSLSPRDVKKAWIGARVIPWQFPSIRANILSSAAWWSTLFLGDGNRGHSNSDDNKLKSKVAFSHWHQTTFPSSPIIFNLFARVHGLNVTHWENVVMQVMIAQFHQGFWTIILLTYHLNIKACDSHLLVPCIPRDNILRKLQGSLHIIVYLTIPQLDRCRVHCEVPASGSSSHQWSE